MTKLGIPIVWFTPAGLKIVQHYLKTEIQKVKLPYYGTNKTAVIRLPPENTQNKKQIQAIIPNIIHSLDASHLINVINTAYDTNIHPVIFVHDCFATHPNKMEQLSNIVTSEFVILYSESDFL